MVRLKQYIVTFCRKGLGPVICFERGFRDPPEDTATVSPALHRNFNQARNRFPSPHCHPERGGLWAGGTP